MVTMALSGALAGGLALALLGWVLGLAWRRGMALFCAGLSIAGGCALIWAHARGVAVEQSQGSQAPGQQRVHENLRVAAGPKDEDGAVHRRMTSSGA